MPPQQKKKKKKFCEKKQKNKAKNYKCILKTQKMCNSKYYFYKFLLKIIF